MTAETYQALAPLARRALPTEVILACSTATAALSRAESEQAQGRSPALFVFDSRGRSEADVARQAQQVGKAYPGADLFVLIDTPDSAAIGACLQVGAAPERLRFLLTPMADEVMVGTLSRTAAQFRAARDHARIAERGDRTVKGLSLEIEELRARLEIAKHAARHDDLTGVLNRAGFVEELTARLARDRQPQTVLMMDLDRFKAVNDTLGHDAGDDLVRKICSSMVGVAPPGGVLARLGGDEFGLIVEAMSETGIAALCAQILKVCAQSRRIYGHEVQVTASIGVAHQGLGRSEVELLRRADLEMYAAKREGRNRFRVFDTALDRATKYRLSIEGGLERALHSGQFHMAYQPIVTAQTGEIKGFEALIRWDSPDHGVISPAEFIPIAEETGLILDIGDWITRQALKDCRRWNGPYVSINLSARQFLTHNVAERFLRYAADADVPPSRIQVELTETAIIDDVERADHNLKILRAAGVRVALDDFGTGYSSLVYLNRFAIDCIKIDKSFVDNVTRDHQSAMIVASVSKLAATLGMSVVAEGVETEAQRQVLIAAGCGDLQGFHFGKPMTSAEVCVLVGGLTADEAGD